MGTIYGTYTTDSYDGAGISFFSAETTYAQSGCKLEGGMTTSYFYEVYYTDEGGFTNLGWGNYGTIGSVEAFIALGSERLKYNEAAYIERVSNGSCAKTWDEIA